MADEEPGNVRNAVVDVFVAGLTVSPIVYLSIVYPDLPNRVGVHWNAHGGVDRWSERNILTVFFPGILGILVQLLLGMLAYDLGKGIQAVEGTDEAAECKRQSLAANLGLIQPMRCLLAMLLCLTSCLVALSTGEARAPAWVSQGIIVLVAAMLVVTLIGVVRIFRLQGRYEQSAAGSLPEFQDANWRWLGSIYYNPGDVSFIVHKRLGIGFTLNFGHRRAKGYVVLFVVILLFTVAAAVAVRG